MGDRKEHKVAVITGANGNLGICIAERLIAQMSASTQLTIVVTSRTLPGVKQAVEKIKQYIKQNEPKGLVTFDYVVFDQCSMVSMLSVAYELKKRFTHIDYLILNSSFALFQGIDYIRAFTDMFKEPLRSFTIGTMKKQGVGKKTHDGLGAVFQANVLSPWYLINEIIPLLENGGRVVYISSNISVPEYLDTEDLEMIKNDKSYETSKYEMELVHKQTVDELYKKHGIQQWMTQPGVFKSTSFVPTLNVFAYFGMMLMFYICRLCGSPYHCIWPELGAVAPVWACLEADPTRHDMTTKYGSSCTRWGGEKMMEAKLESSPSVCKLVYDYVENKRQQWQLRLKDQIVERNLY